MSCVWNYVIWLRMKWNGNSEYWQVNLCLDFQENDPSKSHSLLDARFIIQFLQKTIIFFLISWYPSRTSEIFPEMTPNGLIRNVYRACPWRLCCFLTNRSINMRARGLNRPWMCISKLFALFEMTENARKFIREYYSLNSIIMLSSVQKMK